jgi:hypothetical protein
VAAGHGADGPAVLVDHRVDRPLLLVQAVVVRGLAEPVEQLAGPVEEDGLLGDGRPEPALDGRRGVDVRLGHADQRELVALADHLGGVADPGDAGDLLAGQLGVHGRDHLGDHELLGLVLRQDGREHELAGDVRELGHAVAPAASMIGRIGSSE